MEISKYIFVLVFSFLTLFVQDSSGMKLYFVIVIKKCLQLILFLTFFSSLLELIIS